MNYETLREEEVNSYLHIHPADNVLVALQNLLPDTKIEHGNTSFTLIERIPAKHKFSTKTFEAGDEIIMYGVLVGKACEHIPPGSRITVDNVKHAANDFVLGERKLEWDKPDVSAFENRTFMGFHRADGSVGTANYWLIVPLVFCENRNVDVLKEALTNKLGYKKGRNYDDEVDLLINLYQTGQ